MKQNIFLKKTRVLFLFLFIWNSDLRAQHFDGFGHFISPGNNSCNAGEIFDWGGAISFPVPPGLTLAQLNYLETDFRADFSDPFMAFGVTIQSGCGILYLYFGIADPGGIPGTWINSGNMATAGKEVQFYCGSLQNMQYSDVQALYGSSIVSSINIIHLDNFNTQLDFDNTRINNITYNYDDCDADGLLDIYDCHPNNNGNSKVYVCHEGKTICVAQAALAGHMGHGDYIGICFTASRGITNNVPDHADEFKLSNAPNPLNTTTTIHYELPHESKVTITLYDPVGRVVSKLVDASKKAGVYSYELDASNLAKGIYYYKMTAVSAGEQFVKIEKLMIIR